MVYSVMITFSLSSIMQTGFILYLWTRLLYQDHKLIAYEPMPIAIASAPELKID